MFELFEHTADLGLRVRAQSRGELFADAARGLTAMLVDNPGDVRPAASRQIEVPGEEIDYLFFDWLNELLFLFESEHFLVADAAVEFCEDGLKAVVRGEPLDRNRHQPGHEVKAITYHGLRVEATDAEWIAEVIVDI